MRNDWGLTYNIGWTKKLRHETENPPEAFSVKLCPKCNTVYEMTFNQYKKENNTHYYDDFPRRGLNKRVCYKCV